MLHKILVKSEIIYTKCLAQRAGIPAIIAVTMIMMMPPGLKSTHSCHLHAVQPFILSQSYYIHALCPLPTLKTN